MGSRLVGQPLWVRALVATLTFGVLVAIFHALFLPNGAILLPTAVFTTLWALAYTGYLVWTERR